MAEPKADERDRDEVPGPDRPVHSCGLNSGFDLKGDGKFWERFLRRGGVDLVRVLKMPPSSRVGDRERQGAQAKVATVIQVTGGYGFDQWPWGRGEGVRF